MERIDCILQDSEFKDYVSKNYLAEESRIYCHHDLTHFLDVCRIAWILNLERGLNLAKEVVYAAGLLHDIGRWQEYQTGRDHAEISAELAGPILARCGYDGAESTEILSAIGAHRTDGAVQDLNRILYEADKASRMCLYCDAKGLCKNFQNGEQFFFSD